MPFLMKTILWIVFLAAMYFGGIGTQSSSNFFQGFGFFSIIVACVSLYIVVKLMWGMLGNFSRLALICGVGLYAAFSIGLFNGNSFKSFLSGEPQPYIQNEEPYTADSIDELSIQMFGGDLEYPTQDTEKQPEQPEVQNNAQYAAETFYLPRIVVKKSNSSGINKITSMFGGKNQNEDNQVNILNPFDYPEMRGHPKVISGSILMLNDIQIKLFGIDAPDPTQTCANKFGNSYICGKEAIIWMRDWLNKKDVSCRIISRVVNNRTTGICYSDDGKYDVAAVVVNAGWAVAYTEHTKIYTIYEREAALAHRGLWSGTFYKPWDWRLIQNRKAEIKVQKKFKGFNFKRWF